MEGDTNKDAQSPAPAKQPLAFHSNDISGTKAKEKREVFIKVEEKKTLKQSAAEFQKKFAEAKAHAAESRAKIENPGADKHGVIRSRQRFNIPWKKIIKILIPIFILVGVGLAVYLNWGTIYHEFFEVSENRAIELIETNPERYINIYDRLIEQTDNEEEKIELLYSRISTLGSHYGSKYSEQILKDAYRADEILPCYETAVIIISAEEAYGSQAKADEWRNKLETREMEGLILGNG